MSLRFDINRTLKTPGNEVIEFNALTHVTAKKTAGLRVEFQYALPTASTVYRLPSTTPAYLLPVAIPAAPYDK